MRTMCASRFSRLIGRDAFEMRCTIVICCVYTRVRLIGTNCDDPCENYMVLIDLLNVSNPNEQKTKEMNADVCVCVMPTMALK